MERTNQAKLVSIFLTENERYQGAPLYLAILQHLRSGEATGATILRGVSGFGVHQQIHTTQVEILMTNLPIVIEWIDSAERVERLLPEISAMVTEGLIAVQTVEIYKQAVRGLRPISATLTVADVMTRHPVTITPETSLRDLVELLVRRLYRALPVVDADRHVVGIVTNGDLVERGGLSLRTELLYLLEPEVLDRELERLSETGGMAAGVMTPDVVTIGPTTSLTTAAHLMAVRRLKRLPVVNDDGRLVGIISRVDVLRTLAMRDAPEEEAPRPATHVTPSSTVADVMNRQAPVVEVNATLPEVLAVVVSTRLNRAVVVDEQSRPLGVVTDAELMRRLDPKHHSSVISALMLRLPFMGLTAEEREELHFVSGTRAGDLMIAPALTVQQSTPIVDAARRMLERRYKILPVVDDTGRLVGLIDRADLLRAVVTS